MLIRVVWGGVGLAWVVLVCSPAMFGCGEVELHLVGVLIRQKRFAVGLGRVGLDWAGVLIRTLLSIVWEFRSMFWPDAWDAWCTVATSAGERNL